MKINRRVESPRTRALRVALAFKMRRARASGASTPAPEKTWLKQSESGANFWWGVRFPKARRASAPTIAEARAAVRSAYYATSRGRAVWALAEMRRRTEALGVAQAIAEGLEAFRLLGPTSSTRR
jgi:hypothetical protein